MKTTIIKMLRTIAAGSFCLAGLQAANAASFQIFSGYAFSNPAAYSLIHDYEIGLGGTIVFQDTVFRGRSGLIAVPPPVMARVETDEPLYLPTGRIAKRINDEWVVGVDVSRPYASHEEWSEQSFIRFVGTKTDIQTLNIAPNASYQVGDTFSVGAGADIQYIDADLNSIVPVSFVPLVGTPFRNSGDDWSAAWHVGMLYHAAEGTFLSLTYYSKITHDLTGTSTLGSTVTTNLTVDTTLPSTVIVDVVQYFSKIWLVKGTVSFTNWSELKNLTLQNTAVGSDVMIPLHYKDSWRVALATRYEVDRKWALFGGLSYDKSPSNIHDMSVRAPDGDTTTLAVGFDYNLNENAVLTAAYAHSFVNDAVINNISGSGLAAVNTSGIAEIEDDSLTLSVVYKS